MTSKNEHPSVTFGFSKTKFKCPTCKWIGLGIETIDIGMSELCLYDAGCPICGSLKSLGAVFFDRESGKDKFFPYHVYTEK